MSEAITIAPATDEDLECVRALWAASYRDAAAAKGIRGRQYDRWIAKRSARLLGRGVCLVAKQGDLILGWVVGEADDQDDAELAPVRACVRACVHFIYVKAYARRQGLARELLNELARSISVDPQLPWVYTHRRIPYTFGLEALGWVFRPKLAR